MRWFTNMGRRVMFHDWFIFFFRNKLTQNGPTLSEFWGEAQDKEEIPLRLSQPKPITHGADTPKPTSAQAI
ncbi:MAG: hypothetical protein AAF528_11885 [Cyanobacteria bacterium P01_C01_bin.121]